MSLAENAENAEIKTKNSSHNKFAGSALVYISGELLQNRPQRGEGMDSPKAQRYFQSKSPYPGGKAFHTREAGVDFDKDRNKTEAYG